MRVVNYFSEPTWGGWTMMVSGTETIKPGNIIYDSTRKHEFLVEKAYRLGISTQENNVYVIWLSPNEKVINTFEINDEIIIEEKI